MRKKLFLLLVLAVVSMGASAQFEQKKMYVSTSLTGLGMSYSESEEFTLGLEALGGYFIADDWMLYGRFGYNHTRYTDHFVVGAGFRYYFRQNGIYLGSGLQYEHVTENVNNLHLCPEVGYTYFLNRYLTIEPALYYNMSLNDFANGSKVGLKLGLGYYF